ncbi:DNA repair protein RadA, partial [Lactobacillus delbrueckii subsp. bulgaricus]
RVKEAGKVGFKRIFIPKYNMSPALQDLGIEVIPVSSVRQALHYLFS